MLMLIIIFKKTIIRLILVINNNIKINQYSIIWLIIITIVVIMFKFNQLTHILIIKYHNCNHKLSRSHNLNLLLFPIQLSWLLLFNNNNNTSLLLNRPCPHPHITIHLTNPNNPVFLLHYNNTHHLICPGPLVMTLINILHLFNHYLNIPTPLPRIVYMIK
jgi:hypothetical protein